MIRLNHGELLIELFGSVLETLLNFKLDAAVLVCKELNNLHPEQADSPFQMLDCLR